MNTKPSHFKILLMAIRPKTLWAAIAPVLMGTAMAFRDGLHHFPSAILALVGALAIQIGTNLANDYFDFKKGADQSDRLGPTRVTQAGLVSPRAVQISFILCFLISAAVAYFLYLRGGNPIIIIGVASIISGILYTAGPWPLGYVGLGELFVLIFFGPVAVGGTYYIQALEINNAILLAGFGPGLLSCAILAINNLRDIDGDRKAGKKTLAVRFGRTFAVREYLFVLISAFIIPVSVYWMTQDYIYSLIAVFSFYLSIPTIVKVLTKQDGPSLNQALAETGRLLFIYSLLFSIGWVL